MIIMATNRPYDLDEAMHRRITIAMEFPKPDHILRKEIWASHIPSTLKLADDVDLSELALRLDSGQIFYLRDKSDTASLLVKISLSYARIRLDSS